ncbi:type II secretion system protein J [Chloroflexota bacterium]
MKLLKSQNGFTMTEILVSLAISSTMIVGLVGVIFQVVKVTENTQPQIKALEDIRLVARLVTDDIRKAEGIDLVDGADPVSSVDLYWTDWTETQPYRHECALALTGAIVSRTRNAWVDTNLDWVEDTAEDDIVIDEDLFIGRYVSGIQFSRDGDVIIVTITSSPEGKAETEQSRTYRIATVGLEDPVR